MSHRKPITFLAAAVTSVGLIAPAAEAQPIDTHQPATVVVPAGVNAGGGPAARSTPGGQPQADHSTADGFDVGDAATGAAAMLAMLGVGALVVRRSRERHPAVG